MSDKIKSKATKNKPIKAVDLDDSEEVIPKPTKVKPKPKEIEDTASRYNEGATLDEDGIIEKPPVFKELNPDIEKIDAPESLPEFESNDNFQPLSIMKKGVYYVEHTALINTVKYDGERTKLYMYAKKDGRFDSTFLISTLVNPIMLGEKLKQAKIEPDIPFLWGYVGKRKAVQSKRDYHVFNVMKI